LRNQKRQGSITPQKVGGRVNMVQILCTHVSKCKNDTCDYSRNGGLGRRAEEIKGIIHKRK
jgi:hypothetical protein